MPKMDSYPAIGTLTGAEKFIVSSNGETKTVAASALREAADITVAHYTHSESFTVPGDGTFHVVFPNLTPPAGYSFVWPISIHTLGGVAASQFTWNSGTNTCDAWFVNYKSTDDVIPNGAQLTMLCVKTK